VITVRVLLGLWLSLAGLGANGEEPPMPDAVAFEVKLEVPLQEIHEDFCWFHPRCAAIPGAGQEGAPAVVMTLMKELSASDFYSGLYFMRTDDLGRTWRGPIEIPELAWRRDGKGVIISVADVTPGWHAPTGKLVAIGCQVRYSESGEQLDDVHRANCTAYATYDPVADSWAGWRVLEMPTDPVFDFCRSACSQWLVEADGRLLVPFYHNRTAGEPSKVTVFRCTFDGTEMRCQEQGNTLELNVVRGLCEPSLAAFHGRVYLTLRNDERAYVTVSDDGLNYEPIRPWTFDDGSDLGSYNTQQHWLTHGEGLFLCYTRRGADNDHIPRNRAPLFMAQVDPVRLCVIRATEKVLIPERGLMLGNFGAAAITPQESWVTDSEYLSLKHGYHPSPRGGNGSTFLARVMW